MRFEKPNSIILAAIVFAVAFLLVAGFLAKPLMFDGGNWAEAWQRERLHAVQAEPQRLASLTEADGSTRGLR